MVMLHAMACILLVVMVLVRRTHLKLTPAAAEVQQQMSAAIPAIILISLAVIPKAMKQVALAGLILAVMVVGAIVLVALLALHLPARGAAYLLQTPEIMMTIFSRAETLISPVLMVEGVHLEK